MVIGNSCTLEISKLIIVNMPALVAVIVAVVVACISYQQYKLSKDKFRLDLFEKRFSIYKGVQRFLTHILINGKVYLDKSDEFRRDTQDAIFLFGDEIPNYLDIIDKKALDMWATTEQYKDLPVGKERSSLVSQESILLKELIAELPRLREVFSPYLKFDKWK